MRGYLVKISKGIEEIKCRLSALESEIQSKNNTVFTSTVDSAIQFNEVEAKTKASSFYNHKSILSDSDIQKLQTYFINMERSKFKSDYKEFCRNYIKQLEKIFDIFIKEYEIPNFIIQIQKECAVKKYGKTERTCKLIDLLYERKPDYNYEGYIRRFNEKNVWASEIKTFFDHLLIFNQVEYKPVCKYKMKNYVYSIIKYYKDDDSHANSPKFPNGPNGKKHPDWETEYLTFKNDANSILNSNSPYEILKIYFTLLVEFSEKKRKEIAETSVA